MSQPMEPVPYDPPVQEVLTPQDDEPHGLAAMDGLDLLLLLALLPLHWTLFFLVVAQWFVRRNPALLAGLLNYVGGEALLHSPTAADYLPGLKQLAPAQPAHQAQQPEPEPQALLTTLLHQPPADPHPMLTAQVAPDSKPLPFTEWRKRVLAAHNVIVVGVPQSGKSTLTRAFLPALAKVGQLCLIDPHDQANDWPWQAIGSGRNYQAIGQALSRLTDEMTRRYQQRGPHTPLTVVIDEVPSITLHLKRDWETHYPQLVFEGAKAGIKTWILAQSGQVRPLGLEGKGDLRSSLTWLYLGAQAIERCPACATQAYPAAIEHRGEVRPIDTSPLPVYARLSVDEQAQWAVPSAGNNPERVQLVESHGNQVQPGSAVQPEPADLPDPLPLDGVNLNLTPDELQRLVHALSLRAQGSGKVKALEQAFDCRKGGSAAYQRASWLFNQATPASGE